MGRSLCPEPHAAPSHMPKPTTKTSEAFSVAHVHHAAHAPGRLIGMQNTRRLTCLEPCHRPTAFLNEPARGAFRLFGPPGTKGPRTPCSEASELVGCANQLNVRHLAVSSATLYHLEGHSGRSSYRLIYAITITCIYCICIYIHLFYWICVLLW